MLTSEFDFIYPKGQIAYRPSQRGESKLMVVSRDGKLPSDFPLKVESDGWAFGKTKDLTSIIKPEDGLVLNETKVIHSKLLGKTDEGTHRVIVIKPYNNGEDIVWEVIMSGSRKCNEGDVITFSQNLKAVVQKPLYDGNQILKFNLNEEDLIKELSSIGSLPIPAYLGRIADDKDEEQYQSVFARVSGSAAAPTASLHFSEGMLKQISENGTNLIKVILHVGIGTFTSVSTPSAEDHKMHSEAYYLSKDSADKVNKIKERGGRVFAVGTTASRVIETCATTNGVKEGVGETSLFITPGYKFRAVDCLLTNFHFPKSTLFMLVCSLLGVDRAKQAYQEAFKRGFRLFSYGDAMLII